MLKIFSIKNQARGAWIPAFARMTGRGVVVVTNQRGMAIVIMMIGISGTIMAIGLLMSVVTVNRIKAGTMQLNSTKAYFAAEAGAERILWELRKNGRVWPDAATYPSDQFNAGHKKIYYTAAPPLIFSRKNTETEFKGTPTTGTFYDAEYENIGGATPNKIQLTGTFDSGGNNEVWRIITMKY